MQAGLVYGQIGQTEYIINKVKEEKEQLICSECSEKVRPISGPRCMKCGRPIKSEEEYCEDCRKTYPTVEHGKICPHCGSEHTYLLQGSEFNIKEIEVE